VKNRKCFNNQSETARLCGSRAATLSHQQQCGRSQSRHARRQNNDVSKVDHDVNRSNAVNPLMFTTGDRGDRQMQRAPHSVEYCGSTGRLPSQDGYRGRQQERYYNSARRRGDDVSNSFSDSRSEDSESGPTRRNAEDDSNYVEGHANRRGRSRHRRRGQRYRIGHKQQESKVP